MFGECLSSMKLRLDKERKLIWLVKTKVGRTNFKDHRAYCLKVIVYCFKVVYKLIFILQLHFWKSYCLETKLTASLKKYRSGGHFHKLFFFFHKPSDRGPKQLHTFKEGAIFPHLHKPSCKVYSLNPRPLCYKRAEDLGLFSQQSLSLLIRKTQTLEDNSTLGGVKERWRRMLL